MQRFVIGTKVRTQFSPGKLGDDEEMFDIFQGGGNYGHDGTNDLRNRPAAAGAVMRGRWS